MYLLAFYVVPLVYVQSFVTYVVMYLFIKTLQLHHQRDLRLDHTILNKEIIHKALTSQTYNLCNSFNPDLPCASLCGVEFVFKKKGKEGAAEVRIERVTEISLFDIVYIDQGDI